MPDSGPVLTPEEEAVLEVFNVRQISKGVGLTHDVLASELKWIPVADLDTALAGLVDKGLLSNPVFYHKIYILTLSGKAYVDDHLTPM